MGNGPKRYGRLEFFEYLEIGSSKLLGYHIV